LVLEAMKMEVFGNMLVCPFTYVLF